jgi:DNA-binding LacI/PurR family transcriptional regulator
VQQILARRRRPDGIFAASDGIALATIRAIEAAGMRCPEDVVVVGFDDTDVASHSHPTLTTVKQDIAGIATALVDLLFQRLEGEDTPSVTLPVQLMVRESAPAR